MNNVKEERLSELLFQEERYRLLSFLLDSRESYSIVELASHTDLSRQFVSELVDKLSKLGLVDKRKKGNMNLVSVNSDSAYYDALKQLLEVDSRPLREVAGEFAEDIFQKYDEIVSVVLFGSVARGTPTLDSDIDILIVTENELADVAKGLDDGLVAEAESYNKRYAVNISLTFYNKEKFENDLRASIAFIERVVEEGELLAGERFWQES